MDSRVKIFLDTLNGKKIALCGIGSSNLPLIALFKKYGAQVTACDRRTKEELGDVAQEAQRAGASLSLGERYLDGLDVEILFRTPGMRYYMKSLCVSAKTVWRSHRKWNSFLTFAPAALLQ